MIQSFNPPNMSDFQKRALMVGIVFAGLFIAGLVISPMGGATRFDAKRIFQSYLMGWTFWTGIGVGSPLRFANMITKLRPIWKTTAAIMT